VTSSVGDPWLYSSQGQVPFPFSYTIPQSLVLESETVFCDFDGSGASGDFVLRLSFVSSNGNTIARVPTSQTIKVGDSGSVTWFPFVPPAQAETGLPLWHSILNDLSLNNGTIDHTASRHSYAMVQSPSHLASVFVKVHVVLDDPGDNTLPYQIHGIPSLTWGFGDGETAMLEGWSWTGGLNTWAPPATASYIAASQEVTFPGGVQPAFGTGDILFDGFGVFPWVPE
jgi:hypothetical protein